MIVERYAALKGPRESFFFLGLFYLFIISFLIKSLMFQVSQFYTDLSLYDLEGKEVLRKTIKVNDPLRYGGITIYQTDWSISALQVLKDDEGPFNLAMAPLQMNGGDKKLYGTILPVGSVDSPNVKGMYAYIIPCLLVLTDLQGLYSFPFSKIFPHSDDILNFRFNTDLCLLVIFSQLSFMIKKANLQEFDDQALSFQSRSMAQKL